MNAPVVDAQALVFERCARLSLSLAERTVAQSKRRNRLGPSEPFVADLCRQSIYWSLRALETLRTPEPFGVSGSDAPAFEPRDLEALLRRADPALFSEAGVDAEVVQTLTRDLARRSFVELAEVDAVESARVAREGLPIARRLLRAVERRQWAIDRPWFRRVLWALIALSLLGISIVGVVWGLNAWEARRDLAKGKRWSASSLYTASGGCDSPLQDCSSKPGFFFHTEEENRPWFEIDLGSVQSLSSARIENRQDCCKERAVPLVIEVSSDRKRWKEVVRREQVFDSWKPTFAPEKARYVRMSGPGFRILHLNRVRLFP